jgi:hypothetical protein
MRSLQPHETELRGTWIARDSIVEADEVCRRIKWLVGNNLREVAVDVSGWDVLYLDRADGRYWELTYPQSEMHGGGPPQLKVISKSDAILKYSLPDM